MEIKNKKCEECGYLLEPSQHPQQMRKVVGEVIIGISLVCTNYPNCSKSEKPIVLNTRRD